MSDLFLDTEVRWSVPFLGSVCAASGLDDATLDGVFWCEVFPLAIFNLHDLAGEWAMLELPEPALIARAEKPTRARLEELTSAWMVRPQWEAALVVSRRLRGEDPARVKPLVRLWDVYGKRYLEDLGRKLLSDPTPALKAARDAGLDLDGEWQFYQPVLRSMMLRSEVGELDRRADEVMQMLRGGGGPGAA
ncbi:MAG: hypothetical protein IAE78_25520 [Myxococcus sp.]|nr:hypothetical protein [Myxococcus sp.]